MSKILRINNGDYKLNVRDSAGTIQLSTSTSGTGNIELSTPKVIVDSGTVTTTYTTLNLFNDTATTVNAFGAATSILIGKNSGTLQVHNPSTILDGDLAVNGNDLTSTSTTFNLLNSVVTTVNAFGNATAVNIGASAGTVTIAGNLVVNGDTTTINSTNMTVDDINIILHSTTTPGPINSGGITLQDGTDSTGDKTLNWYTATDAWTSNVNFDIGSGKSYKIGNTDVLTTSTVLPNATSVTAFQLASTIDIGASSGTLTIKNSNVILDGDLAVNGGDITTTATSATVFNANSTTVNAFGAATTIHMGTTTAGGVFTIYNPSTVLTDLAVNGGDVTTTATAVNLFTTNATTVNAFTSATSINLGASSGTLTINNSSVSLDGDIAVNGGDITTTAASANIFNTNATTVNAFDAATVVNIGSVSGTLTIKNSSVVLDGDLAVYGGDITTTATSATVFNTTATTINAFSAATTINLGASSGTLTIKNSNVVLNGDLAVNGGDITTSSTTASIFNTTATTVNAFGAAGTINIGTNSGTLTIQNDNVTLAGDLAVNGGDIITSSSTVTMFPSNALTVSAFGSATSISIGATSGTLTLKNSNVILDGDLVVNGGDVTTNAGTLNLFNTNATTANVLQSSSIINIGPNNGTLTIQNDNVVLRGDIAVNGGDVTSSASSVNLFNANSTVNVGTSSSTINIGSGTTAVNIPGILHMSGSVVGTHTLDEVNVYNTTTLTPIVVDSFNYSIYRSGKYVIQMEGSGDFHTCELSVLHNGSTISFVPYLDNVIGNSCGSFDAQFNGINIEIVFTPTINNLILTIVKKLIAI